MKRALSGLDLVALVREMQAIAGARIDKVYQPDRDQIVISLSIRDEGKVRLNARFDGWLWVARSAEEMPAEPSAFAMLLRKHLSNGRIASVSQHGCDRIVELGIEKDGGYRLIFELFGEGNLILVSDDTIVAPLRQRKWKHRELRARKKYLDPPATFDPRSAHEERFSKVIRASKADIVRTLATRINLGGEYSEEICKRLDIPKDLPASEITDEALGAIWKAISDLIRELDGPLYPHISFEGEQPVDVAPIRLVADEGRRPQEFPSFSEAIDGYVASLPKDAREEDAGLSEERGRLLRTLAAQEEAVEKFREGIDVAQNLATHIFEHYGEVEAKIDEVRTALASGATPPGVEVIDPGSGLFRTMIEDKELVLSWNRSVTECAQYYYDEVKNFKAKLEGALQAIEETKGRIEKAKDEEFVKSLEVAKERGSRRRAAWFESYRWFISSEGAIVIAGKDAKSNEMVVKRHLKQGDRYVHADIHGAPSTVVKATEGMSETTLREAGIFSLAMSKAWRSGVAAGTAYWVTPDQVSKTPESGEFLARGSFVIRGKRTYFDKLELRLAIGVCGVMSEDRKVMCGPVSAVARHCEDFVELVPGELSKESAAKELAKRFRSDISEIQSVMPPGSVRIVEKGAK